MSTTTTTHITVTGPNGEAAQVRFGPKERVDHADRILRLLTDTGVLMGELYGNDHATTGTLRHVYAEVRDYRGKLADAYRTSLKDVKPQAVAANTTPPTNPNTVVPPTQAVSPAPTQSAAPAPVAPASTSTVTVATIQEALKVGTMGAMMAVVKAMGLTCEWDGRKLRELLASQVAVLQTPATAPGASVPPPANKVVEAPVAPKAEPMASVAQVTAPVAPKAEPKPKAAGKVELGHLRELAKLLGVDARGDRDAIKARIATKSQADVEAAERLLASRLASRAAAPKTPTEPTVSAAANSVPPTHDVDAWFAGLSQADKLAVRELYVSMQPAAK